MLYLWDNNLLVNSCLIIKKLNYLKKTTILCKWGDKLSHTTISPSVKGTLKHSHLLWSVYILVHFCSLVRCRWHPGNIVTSFNIIRMTLVFGTPFSLADLLLVHHVYHVLFYTLNFPVLLPWVKFTCFKLGLPVFRVFEHWPVCVGVWFLQELPVEYKLSISNQRCKYVLLFCIFQVSYTIICFRSFAF